MDDTPEEVAGKLLCQQNSAKLFESNVTPDELNFMSSLLEKLRGSEPEVVLQYLHSDVPRIIWKIACDTWNYGCPGDHPDAMHYLCISFWVLCTIGNVLECQQSSYEEDLRSRGAWLIESSNALWQALFQHEEHFRALLQNHAVVADVPSIFLRSVSRLSAMISRLHHSC